MSFEQPSNSPVDTGTARTSEGQLADSQQQMYNGRKEVEGYEAKQDSELNEITGHDADIEAEAKLKGPDTLENGEIAAMGQSLRRNEAGSNEGDESVHVTSIARSAEDAKRPKALKEQDSPFNQARVPNQADLRKAWQPSFEDSTRHSILSFGNQRILRLFYFGIFSLRHLVNYR